MAEDKLKSAFQKVSDDISNLSSKIEALENSKVDSGDYNKRVAVLKDEIKSIEEGFNKDLKKIKKSVNEQNKKISDINDIRGLIEENNFLKKEVVRLSNEFYKINKEFRDQLANDRVLYRELKLLNDSIYKDRRLDLDKVRLQKKVDRYTDKKITEFRTLVLYISCGVFAFLVFFYFYFTNTPFAFPGITGKIVLVVSVLLLLLILLFLPWKKIINWFKKWMFFRKGKFDKLIDYFDEGKK